jgi:glycosyltransferase involved in cell wall biosynthesis
VADPSAVSIVVPAFNESESIAEVVGILRAAGDRRWAEADAKGLL